MCLIIVRSRLDSDSPLVFAANRDEHYERPAVNVTVLQDQGPRILGGRDLLAGGTWLAVNEHGVAAGLTNRPTGGRDQSKRSRGELPILLARHRDAASAVEAFVTSVDPADYNPCWLLVGDRSALYFLDMTTSRAPAHRALEPGQYVLENRALGMKSPKIDLVADHLQVLSAASANERAGLLAQVLGDHELPSRRDLAHGGPAEPDSRPELQSACVHSAHYGTRSSSIIEVSSDPEVPPRYFAADGPPCTTPFIDVSELWSQPVSPLNKDSAPERVAT